MKNLKEVKIGTFKLKDKAGKNAIQLDLTRIFKNYPGAKFLYVTKNFKESNKVTIFVKYEDAETIPQVQFNKD